MDSVRLGGEEKLLSAPTTLPDSNENSFWARVKGIVLEEVDIPRALPFPKGSDFSRESEKDGLSRTK